MDGIDGTREDTDDTTMITRTEVVNCDIRSLPFVTKLSPVDTHKDKSLGGGLFSRTILVLTVVERDKGPVPVQFSCDLQTELVCVQELLKRLQDRHGE